MAEPAGVLPSPDVGTDPVPGWAVIATELPGLPGTRLTVLGLHNGEHGQFVHLARLWSAVDTMSNGFVACQPG